jgi:hypothetical protein
MAHSGTREILAKALKARAELAAELAAVDEVIHICRERLRASAPKSDSRPEQLDLYGARSSRRANAQYVAELVEATRRVLVEEGAPLKRGALVKRLEERGYEIRGSDKTRVFGTILWRSKRFVAVAGSGYWPADLDIPAHLKGQQPEEQH